MKPTIEEVSESVVSMSRVIAFFPTDDLARAIIVQAVFEFCGQKQGLDWMTNTAMRVMPKWLGIAGLRGLYCTRYKPCDNLPATASDIPGFTPDGAMDAAEMAYLERESRETDRKLAEWKREYKQLGQSPSTMQLLPAGSNAMPETPKERSDDPRVQRVDNVIAAYQGAVLPYFESPKILTREDIKRAEAELREKRPSEWSSFEDAEALKAEPWFQELHRER